MGRRKRVSKALHEEADGYARSTEVAILLQGRQLPLRVPLSAGFLAGIAVGCRVAVTDITVARVVIDALTLHGHSEAAADAVGRIVEVVEQTGK